MIFWFGVWAFLALIVMDFIISATSKDNDKYDNESEGSDVE